MPSAIRSNHFAQNACRQWNSCESDEGRVRIIVHDDGSRCRHYHIHKRSHPVCERPSVFSAAAGLASRIVLLPFEIVAAVGKATCTLATVPISIAASAVSAAVGVVAAVAAFAIVSPIAMMTVPLVATVSLLTIPIALMGAQLAVTAIAIAPVALLILFIASLL